MATEDVKKSINLLSTYFNARMLLFYMKRRSEAGYNAQLETLTKIILPSLSNEKVKNIIQACELEKYDLEIENPFNLLFDNTLKLSKALVESFDKEFNLKSDPTLLKAIQSIISYSLVTFYATLFDKVYSTVNSLDTLNKAKNMVKKHRDQVIEYCTNTIIPFLNQIDEKAVEAVEKLDKNSEDHKIFLMCADLISAIFKFTMYLFYI